MGSYAGLRPGLVRVNLIGVQKDGGSRPTTPRQSQLVERARRDRDEPALTLSERLVITQPVECRRELARVEARAEGVTTSETFDVARGDPVERLPGRLAASPPGDQSRERRPAGDERNPVVRLIRHPIVRAGV